MHRRQMKKLHAFMMRHLRSIIRITWMVKVTIKEILERTVLPYMKDFLIRNNIYIYIYIYILMFKKCLVIAANNICNGDAAYLPLQYFSLAMIQ